MNARFKSNNVVSCFVSLGLIASINAISAPVRAQSLGDIFNTDNVCGFNGYKSDKPQLKEQVAAGNWTPAWSDDISETDLALVAVSSGSYAAPLVERTISSLTASLSNNLRNEIQEFVETVFKDVGRGNFKNVVRNYDRFDIKAGGFQYRGGNYACGNLVTPTTGV